MHRYFKIENVALVIILIIASYLRLFHLSESCFTNDELSALNRLHFNSFGELIHKGVQVDAHPAFTQLLLYITFKITGEYSYLIRIPFILLGVASIGIFYFSIAKKHSWTVASIVCIFLATSPYFIMMHQMARPYAPGLFFIALLYYAFAIDESNHTPTKWNILMTIALAGVAYTHYLALLTAAIFYVIKFFFLPKIYRKTWLLSALLALVLYVPYLPVFFHQIQLGGVGGSGGWLWKPNPGFVMDILSFMTSRSLITGILFGMALLISIYKRAITQYTPEWLTFLCVLIFCYIYSIGVNPILQYYVLCFSGMIVLPAILSFSGNLSLHWNNHKRGLQAAFIIFALSIPSSTLFALFISRDYYTRFYHQSYDQIAQFIKNEKLDAKATILCGNGSYFYDHYFTYYQIHPSVFSYKCDTLSLIEFDSLVRTIPSSQLVFGETIDFNRNRLDIIQKYFPVLFKQSNGVEYDIYAFSKDTLSTNPAYKNIHPAIYFTSDSLDGNSLTFPVEPMIDNNRMEIQIHTFIKLEHGANAVLCTECLDAEKKPFHWSNAEFRNYESLIDSGYIFNHFQLNPEQSKKCRYIKTYLQNTSRRKLEWSVIETNVFAGNKWQWSVIE